MQGGALSGVHSAILADGWQFTIVAAADCIYDQVMVCCCAARVLGVRFVMDTDVYRILDLFCGAGGLSLGFMRAGFEITCAIDNNHSSLQTYARNMKHRVTEHDLSYHISIPKVGLIIGGPPCQGFSSSGLRRSNDRRNSLFGRFANIIAESRPNGFLFENVEGFLTAEQGDRIIDLLDPLIEAGYHIHLRKVNAANLCTCADCA